MSRPTNAYEKLVDTVALLRAPGGCPWDREQTHQSLTECLIEECSELIEAIDRNDMEHMREEIGDVLLNLLMQAEIAHEAGHFDMETVCADITEKLIRRHPHVFQRESCTADNAGAVLKRWDEIKASEKKNGPLVDPQSPFKPQPPRLPALLFAKKTFKQVQKAGLGNHATLPNQQIQELSDLSETDIGSLFFALAAVCRMKGFDPEQATRSYTQQVIDTLSNTQQDGKS